MTTFQPHVSQSQNTTHREEKKSRPGLPAEKMGSPKTQRLKLKRPQRPHSLPRSIGANDSEEDTWNSELAAENMLLLLGLFVICSACWGPHWCSSKLLGSDCPRGHGPPCPPLGRCEVEVVVLVWQFCSDRLVVVCSNGTSWARKAWTAVLKKKTRNFCAGFLKGFVLWCYWKWNWIFHWKNGGRFWYFECCHSISKSYFVQGETFKWQSGLECNFVQQVHFLTVVTLTV